MIRRIVAGTVLASMCLLMVAASAAAGEKSHVIRICTPEDVKKEHMVIIDDDGSAWLGVVIKDAVKASEKGEKKASYGVYVSEVYEDSPAEAAGLEEGDVIVKLAGKKTGMVDELIDVMDQLEPGDEVEVTILRDDEEQMMIAVLGTREEREIWLQSGPFMGSLKGLESLAVLGDLAIPWIELGQSGPRGRGRLGVYIDDLSKGLAEYFEVPEGKGVLVEGVVEDSPAEKAGMKAGDIIIEVGDDRVVDRVTLIGAISELETDVESPVVVIRKGKELTLMAVVGESEYDKAIKEYKEAMKIYADEMSEARATIIVEGESAEELKEELEELKEELEEMKEELEELREED